MPEENRGGAARSAKRSPTAVDERTFGTREQHKFRTQCKSSAHRWVAAIHRERQRCPTYEHAGIINGKYPHGQ